MFLYDVNYQPVVDALIKVGNQLNKPSYRFLKGELIALALEKATKGRLRYVDQEGYDSLDVVTGIKYELKSTSSMFSKDDKICGRVSLCNTNKSKLDRSFDYLLCIQSDPKKFAIAQLTWQECSDNVLIENGQCNLAKGILVKDWICKDRTILNRQESVNIDIRKILENVI